MKLTWGKEGQLQFKNEKEYYESLGALCHDDKFHITYETNSKTNSWSDALRIKCNTNNLSDAFSNARRDANRINCNEYVTNLYQNHNFNFDKKNKKLSGDYNKVRETVPKEYQGDFEKGYNRYL